MSNFGREDTRRSPVDEPCPEPQPDTLEYATAGVPAHVVKVLAQLRILSGEAGAGDDGPLQLLRGTVKAKKWKRHVDGHDGARAAKKCVYFGDRCLARSTHQNLICGWL